MSRPPELPCAVRRSSRWARATRYVQPEAGFVGILLFLALGVYLPVLGHEFLLFDDPQVVTENAHVQQGLSPQSLKWAVTTTHFSNWHPLTWMSLMLDWQVYGGHPAGFHLTNLLLHLGAVLGLFFALRRMTDAAWPSFCVAALFAVHPLHVQSVAWIAERKGLLSTFFWMAALVAYAEYVRRPGAWRYSCVALALVLSLLSKQMAVTLPFALLLLDFWPLRRHQALVRGGATAGRAWLRLAIEKVPLMLIAASFCFIAYYAQASGGALRSIERYPLTMRAANAIVSYAVYLRRLVWPSDLSFHYHNYGRYPTAVELAAAALLLTACISIAIWSRRTRPWFSVGAAWYFGTLLPVIGLVQVGDHRMADRYADVPAVGMFVAFAFALPLSASSTAARRWTCRAVMVVAIVVLACAAHGEVRYWRNSEVLFQRALALDSRNPKAHTNLGVFYARTGKPDVAIFHYRQTLAVLPSDPFANNNLGHLLAMQGQNQDAIMHFRRALLEHPKYADARLNLSSALARGGQFEEAEQILREMIGSDPTNWTLRGNLAAVYARQHKLRAAIDEYRRALRLNPHAPSLNLSFAKACCRVEDWETAREHFLRTIELNPDVLDAYLGAARAAACLGETHRASVILQVAWSRWPGTAAIMAEVARNLASNPQATSADLERAQQLAKAASAALNDQDAELMYTRSIVNLAAGNHRQGEDDRRRALKLAKQLNDPGLIAEIEQANSSSLPREESLGES